MSVDPFDTGALYDVRDTIKAAIDAELSDTVTVHSSWGPTPTGPTVILDGGGWTRTTGCGFDYTVRINVCNGNQAGSAVPGVEECARQVFDVLVAVGYPIQTVPPSGTLKIGDRDYPSIQMTLVLSLTPEG